MGSESVTRGADPRTEQYSTSSNAKDLKHWYKQGFWIQIWVSRLKTFNFCFWTVKNTVLRNGSKEYVCFEENTVLWIQISGSGSGFTPKCHGSGTLLSNKKTRPVLNYKALFCYQQFCWTSPSNPGPECLFQLRNRLRCCGSVNIFFGSGSVDP